MTRYFRALFGVFLLGVLVACAPTPSKIKTYTGPAVTMALVQKSSRKLYLMHNNQVLKSYDVGLGYEPIGSKMFEGDGRTPEGVYFIDRFNPNSLYHLSVGISYPSPADTARAATYGLPAGRDIFIHGRGAEGALAAKKKIRDWTAGCIAVNDKEIEEVFSMLRPGVPIVIQP
ncbi:hypothetical protein DRW48_01385 [Paracoccus suum]|uniref:L,D-TPase catalytic domain-containing protein n=1 Tax=Paracoccus suum TaxID=2259340 RepID=A0A344PGM6_9RHOB|nr:L,D-transpeptidase family protein [Paracoccus suum]AXC48531.1 hypothetical protein DRW48_01385 [Paracoccus suum]